MPYFCSALQIFNFQFTLRRPLRAAVAYGLICTLCCLTVSPGTAVLAQTDDAEAQPARFGIQKHGAIVYHKTEKYLVKCDVYQPVAEVKTDQLMPAVMMIHGGAWRSGSKIALLRHARRLARVGYVVVAINYRLAPKYPWPAQIEDCRVALDWLHAHADQYSVDPQRVGVYGYSAGAQLASMLATTNEKNERIKIRAAAVGGNPADFSWIDEESTVLAYWLGTSPSAGAEVYSSASPINFVTPDDPPVFAFHGDADLVVPVESARRFHQTLKKQNVESELTEVAGYGHFATFSKMDLMPDVIKFFDRHLKSEPAMAEK